MRYRRLLVPILATVTLVLSGCIVFVFNVTTGQLSVIGPVEIISALCGSDEDGLEHAGCPDRGNSGIDSFQTSDAQILIGYRIPIGSEGPDSFVTDTAPAPLTFSKSPSYASELQRLSPAPAGQYWVGYISQPFAYDDMNAGAPDPDSAEEHRISVSPHFTLPRGPDGSPFQGPFLFRQVVGGRYSTSPGDVGRPVNCGSSFIDGAPDYTYCGDDPALSDIPTNTSRSTRDLGVLGGPALPFARGRNATVPFTAKFAGSSDESANFSLSASTTVPGASATPSQPSLLPPTDSSTPINVSVPVPAGTPTRTYDVTLTARLANGETRSNTRQIAVSDQTRPGVRVSVPRGQTVASVLSRGLRLRVRLNEAGRVTDELFVDSGLLARPVRVARRTTRFTRASTKTVRLKLSRRARSRSSRARLLRPRRVTIRLRATARDLAGNRRQASKRIRLRRR